MKFDLIAIMASRKAGLLNSLPFIKAAGADGFVAGLAMYPACIRAVNNQVHLAKPVLVLAGSEDAVTPVADCARCSHPGEVLDGEEIVQARIRGKSLRSIAKAR